jgi:hypothetical protein
VLSCSKAAAQLYAAGSGGAEHFLARHCAKRICQLSGTDLWASLIRVLVAVSFSGSTELSFAALLIFIFDRQFLRILTGTRRPGTAI